MLDSLEIPKWVSALLTEKFFNACIIHEEEKKNEKNVFCLDCCEGICPHCVVDHSSHRLLQIRRYVYHDVIRLSDGDKLMDCAKVQPYTTNSSKVIFLKQRPSSRPPLSGSLCLICDRNLHEPYRYCSISCKLQHLLGTGRNLLKYFCKFDCLQLSELGLDDGQMTPDSVLEITGSLRTESGSINGAAAAGLTDCTATTEVKKKKRTSLSGVRSNTKPVCKPVSGISESEVLANRRKGTPRRSPFH